MKPVITSLRSGLLALCLAPSAIATDWAETFSAETARAELTALYETLQASHYDLYAHRSEADYDALYSRMLADLAGPVSRYDLYLTLQAFTAFGNVAHARIDFPTEVFQTYRAEGGRTFPIYPRIVDGRVYVGEDYSGLDAISPGDEILSIDGVPMADWLVRTSRLISADTPYIAHSLLELTFPLYFWVETGPRDAFTLELRSGETVRSVSVPALTRADILANAENTPAVFSLDAASRDARMLEGNIAYFRPGPFYNFENPENLWDTSDFTTFLDASFETFLSEGADSLIIDLRDNPGGDNSFSDPIIAWIADQPFRFSSDFLVRSSDAAAASNQARLDANPETENTISARYAQAYANTPRGEVFSFDIPIVEPRDGERFEGEVYVLINRHSYSNAVTTASIFQDYGWGVIAGEKTADMATTYGAMEQFTLPETGFVVGFPKALIVRPSGDRVSDGVTPDLVIEAPIVPGSDDAVLNALIRLITAD